MITFCLSFLSSRELLGSFVLLIGVPRYRGLAYMGRDHVVVRTRVDTNRK